MRFDGGASNAIENLTALHPERTILPSTAALGADPMPAMTMQRPR
jgi:hypothetical protein